MREGLPRGKVPDRRNGYGDDRLAFATDLDYLVAIVPNTSAAASWTPRCSPRCRRGVHQRAAARR
jgi:hypothetical protein